MKKNQAGQKLTVFAFNNLTNLPVTGDQANITAFERKDYGSVVQLADVSAEQIDATKAAGYYTFDLTTPETNADNILFSAKSTTSNVIVMAVPAVEWPEIDLETFFAEIQDGETRDGLLRAAGAGTAGNTSFDPNTGAFTVLSLNGSKTRVQGVGTKEGRTVSATDLS